MPPRKAKSAGAKKSAKRAASDAEDESPAKKAKVDIATPSPPDVAPKMVQVIKRGAAPVDPHSTYVDTHQVYSADGEVWDAMLNQTNLGANANKFYVIQLLHPIGNPASSMLYTRWGRVGEKGSTQVKGPFAASTATAEFAKQFKSKTGCVWQNRKGSVAAKGKYTFLERDFEDDEETKPGGSVPKETAQVPDTKLGPELQVLCKLIFSTSLLDAHLSSMNYDANRLPLGKLAKSTILAGFSALKKLAEVIQDPDCDTAKSYGGKANALEELTNSYYSIIPHAVGRNRPPPITTEALLKRELDLVDALGDMEVASKLIASSSHVDKDGNALNPLDAHLTSLDLSYIAPVAAASGEFNALERYVRDTHGQTHHFRSQLNFAFRVGRASEERSWKDAGFDKLADGERMLLWHGSRSTNFAGILKQGLRIAPPEAPVTGYMFGKGVYFADMMSKSANYCHSHLSENYGILLLCEVAAKPFFEQNNANYTADVDCKRAEKLCTKGVGRTQPTEWQDAGDVLGHPELKGCIMPKGSAKDVSPPGAYLQYNEYIVYSSNQIRVRYLLMVKMQ